MDFFFEYGLFAAKALTVVVAILVVVMGIVAVSGRGRREQLDGEVSVVSINDAFEDMKHAIEGAVVDKAMYKQQLKEQKKQDKKEAKEKKQAAKRAAKAESTEQESRPRCYVLDFNGDVKASEVDLMREEISAILTFARPEDEVVLRLDSAGGMVHTYGLAASQLERIKQRNIPLTICVDEVAASGGYMMACLADKLIAAPFAIVGSIGVVAQLPNFNKVLKKHDVDYEMFTAGEYKRTVTMLGENTDKGRAKFQDDLEDTHQLFKEFVASARPELEIEKVATGEIWYGKRAKECGLVDELSTSDDYLMSRCDSADVYRVRYEQKKSLQDKISEFTIKTTDGIATKVATKVSNSRFFMR